MECRRPGLSFNAISVIVLASVLLWSSLSAGAGPDTLSLKHRLRPLTVDNIFKADDYYQWCTSIVKGEDGRYHLFYSRWKKNYAFTGWLTHSEVAHAVSETPCGPWRYERTVLKGRGRGHWDAITAHNPKMKRFDGKYYLYYCSTNLGDKDYTDRELIETARTGYRHANWKILRPNQRTGVAVADSLDGPWGRTETPLIEPSGPITTLTVNPAIDRGPDGRYYLIVKGDKPNEERFIRNQAIAVSDTPTGPFAMGPRPVIGDLDTEDMSLWYDVGRHRFYGVFHAHTFIGMITSGDGFAWEKAAEYVLCPKVLALADGSEIRPDRLERPFVYVEGGRPKVLSLAVKKGDEAYCAFIPIDGD